MWQPREFSEWQRPLLDWLKPLNEWQRPLNEWQSALQEWNVPSIAGDEKINTKSGRDKNQMAIGVM